MMLASSSAPIGAKSPEAFRTISEVSIELEVPQHVLRFWEGRFAQIKPVKRAGGRRYYRPEDVDLLRGIRALLYLEGFTIKGVQKVLRERGLRYVAEFGRGETVEKPSSRKLAEFIAVPEEPQFARAALAVLEQTQDDAAPDSSASRVDPVKAEHAKLELLLAELEQLKVRLRSASSRSRI